MRIGSRSSEVTRLQELLAKDSSLYPQKIVSGYYGQLTEAAIKKLKINFNVDIMLYAMEIEILQAMVL